MCVCSSECLCVCEGRCEFAKKALTSSFITLVCFLSSVLLFFHFLKKLRRDYIAFVYSTYVFSRFVSIDRVYYVCFLSEKKTPHFCFFLVFSSCEILLLSNSQGCVKLRHTYRYTLAHALLSTHTDTHTTSKI